VNDLQLIEAAKAANLADVRRMLEAGADVNQQDEQGWTALNWAAGKGDVAIIQLLLENGADVFKVGRDQRTPYLIALAAGRVEAMRLIKDAESKTGGAGTSHGPQRLYCKAYQLKQLRCFPGWPQNMINGRKRDDNKDVGNTGSQDGNLSDDEIVFVHQNLIVTQSPWETENVLFDLVTPEWIEFCTESLKFKAADDFDLVTSAMNLNNNETGQREES
jgi:hypothetical protein